MADRYASWREVYWRQRSQLRVRARPRHRQAQLPALGFQELGRAGRRRIWSGEHHPEVILDDAEGGLSPAHRPLDEGHDVVVGVVQQEPVPGLHRQLVERDEGVRDGLGVVRGQGRDGVTRFEEQLAPAPHPRLAEGVGQVGLVHDRLGIDAQPVIHPLHAGWFIGPPGDDAVDGLAGRRPRAHQVEEPPLGIALEVQVRQEQVLEQVARDQLLFQRVAVEERFPGPDLVLHRRRQRRGRLRRCAGGQPPFDQRELGVVDRRHSVGHPPQRLMLLVLRLLFQPGAFSFGVERQLEARRQQATGWCRVPALLRQQLIQQAAREVRVAGLAALVQHREEAALAPARRGAGVLVQPGELGRAHPGLVDRFLRGPAGDSVPALHLQLAGGVVAGVTDDATAFEQRPDLSFVRDGAGRGRRTLVERRRVRLPVLVIELPIDLRAEQRPAGGGRRTQRCQANPSHPHPRKVSTDRVGRICD